MAMPGGRGKKVRKARPETKKHLSTHKKPKKMDRRGKLRGDASYLGICRSNLVIGLTGPFGSGCSTMCEVLENNFGFASFKISDDIREEVKGERRSIRKGSRGWRKILQEHGDKRRNEDIAYWVKKALGKVDAGDIGEGKIVIDGFRNFREAQEIRRIYPRFFLLAIYAEKDERWKRVHDDYKGRQNEFEDDDRRDKSEDFEWGQSVQKCVDDADYVFYNNEHHVVTNQGKESPRLGTIKRDFERQAEDFVSLMEGTGVAGRGPKPEEVQIAAAYAQSHSSACMKRHVGAVITVYRNGQEFPISMGYNENPPGIPTCLKQGECYKDEDMDAKLGALKNICCVLCGKKYNELKPPWICDCGASFKEWLHRNRNMELCTAIHAEERAILSLGGRSADGGTLYVTTFPCFQCARLIIDAKIERVVFVEAYPVAETRRFLEGNGVKVEPFTGFTARAFFRVFSKVS